MKKILLIVCAFALHMAKGQTIVYPLVGIDTVQKVSAARLAADTTLPDYVSPSFQNAQYGDTVQIEGIVTFDPHYYGLSKKRKSAFLQVKNGGQWTGIEVMIDTSIFGRGSANPTLNSLNTTTKFYDNFQPGLTVRCTGVIRNFPASNARTGHTQLMLLEYESVITNSTPDTINPNVVTIDQFSTNNGSGGQNWLPTTGEPYEGMYVEFQNVAVTDVAQGTGANSARWFWSLVDANNNKIRIRDYSAYYRNDDNEDYFIANNYKPYKNATYLTYVRGVIVENISSGGVVEYMLAPLTASDVGPVSTSIPPVVKINSYTPSLPNSKQDVTVTATITDDSTVASANVYYNVSGSTFTPVAMTNTSGNTWTAMISKQADGSYVKFYVQAIDNGGSITYFPDTFGTGYDYIVKDSGITKISQIQSTPYAFGNSLWAGSYVPLNITGIVTAGSSTSDLGMVVIQDDITPYSGIFLNAKPGDGLNALQRGDKVNITAALVREIGGCTYLDSLKGNFSVVSSSNALPAFYMANADSVILKAYNETEAYEGMLIKYNDVYVTQINADITSNFGEWLMHTDTTVGKGFRMASKAPTLGLTFNADSLALKQKMSYAQGVLWHSFGNFKMLPRNRDDMDLSNLPDRIAPVITLLGKNPDSLYIGNSYTDQGATAMDNKDGNITAKIKSTSTIDSTKTGKYKVCYAVTDMAGNSSQLCRDVTVYKNTAIANPSLNAFNVWPNPANNMIYFEGIDKNIGVCSLIDLEGKTILDNINVQKPLDISSITPGVYILSYRSNNETAYIKLVIAK
ncbi:MAG: DUF5011 domain-containing protein [Bacteroidota bacterium]|nr:DUF5011 domain-containing protein [Bacteroidota bacterium]